MSPPGGTVSVTFRPDHAQQHAVLTICDDGPGVQEARKGGAGLRLLGELVRQIDGHWQRHEAEPSGTVVRVEFPLAQPLDAGGES